MIPFLLDLTLRGGTVTAAVLVLDCALTKYMRPRWRRAWWILAALAWLVPIRLPNVPTELELPLPTIAASPHAEWGSSEVWIARPANTLGVKQDEVLGALLLAGTFAALTATLVRTVCVARRWNSERLCSNPEILELLEDCKSDSGVTAPIGLVLTTSVSTPVLLGWLRPRILLPQILLKSASRKQLRAILLHELAHFHSADIPVNWLFSIAMALHWFNPVVYLASWRWRKYCEFAADASALDWMPCETREDYGKALITALKNTHELPVPKGALALGESFEGLKERIRLVASEGTRTRMAFLSGLVAFAVVVFVALPSRGSVVLAEDPLATKSAAIAFSDKWLENLDDGKCRESWSSLSPQFQKVFTVNQWNRVCATELAWANAESARLHSRITQQWRDDPMATRFRMTRSPSGMIASTKN